MYDERRAEISSPSSTGYIQSVGFSSGCLFLLKNDINAQLLIFCKDMVILAAEEVRRGTCQAVRPDHVSLQNNQRVTSYYKH